MPRIRTVKPEYWTDEKIVELSITARLFFIGLWNFADDNGVLENKPKQLKIRIFPTDDVEVTRLIDELNNLNLIITYETNGASFIYIRNLTKHQVIDRSRKSNLPTPPIDLINQQVVEIKQNQLKSPEISPGREGKGIGKERKTTPPTPLRGNGVSVDFERFWSVYPKKIGKQAALKKWQALKRTYQLPPPDQIIGAVEKQKTWDQWQKDEGQFIPNPATWLNQGRWDDQPPEGGKPEWMRNLSES